MEFIGLAAGLLGLDLFLKGKIESQASQDFPRPLEGAGGRIKLYKNHNDGFCFGFLKKNRELVKMVPVMFTSAAAGIFAWLLTRKSPISQKLGFSLILSGALSNLYDRLKRGYVIDYFSIQAGFLKKIVFNIGDMCIFLGTVILVIDDIRRD